MKKALLLLALFPAFAFGQGVTRAKPARVHVSSPGTALAVASGAAVYLWMPVAGRIVDVVFNQVSAGTGGTSYTYDIKTMGGTSLLSTVGVATLAAGANVPTDAVGELALPSGWTRPVLGASTVTKGQRLQVVTVETGTYSPHPAIFITVVVEPTG